MYHFFELINIFSPLASLRCTLCACYRVFDRPLAAGATGTWPAAFRAGPCRTTRDGRSMRTGAGRAARPPCLSAEGLDPQRIRPHNGVPPNRSIRPIRNRPRIARIRGRPQRVGRTNRLLDQFHGKTGCDDIRFGMFIKRTPGMISAEAKPRNVLIPFIQHKISIGTYNKMTDSADLRDPDQTNGSSSVPCFILRNRSSIPCYLCKNRTFRFAHSYFA